MIMSLLFSRTSLGPLSLQNRLVMGPMTRSRAIGNIPNDLMAQYYAQRASAGLIITEGTCPPRTGSGTANPDLVVRWKTGAPLNAPDFGTFYTPGPTGYTDYPALGSSPV
jgi:2,4-dienoyl-CoA reductase-like NADH-dependent reductase (Old Yellow Enzyme family)